MTKVIKGEVKMVIGENYKYKRKKRSQMLPKTSGYGKKLFFTVETGGKRLEKILFAGSCPIEREDQVKVIAYEKKVEIFQESYYEAKEIHKIRFGKESRVDYSSRENNTPHNL